jgi:hypothetical protein
MSIRNANDLPRVSTILRILDDSYAGVPAGVLEHAAERGDALHKLCLTYLASLGGMCEPPTACPNEYMHAYLSFVAWTEKQHVEPIAVEQQSISTAHGFTGTPDALVTVGAKKIPTILDLKFTASILRTNRVQVQAYWRLDLYKDAQRVLLLHIKPQTGELKAHTITKNPHDWAGFLNALSIWKWRQS